MRKPVSDSGIFMVRIDNIGAPEGCNRFGFCPPHLFKTGCTFFHDGSLPCVEFGMCL